MTSRSLNLFRLFLFALFVAVALSSALPTAGRAQGEDAQPSVQPTDIGPSGDAYLKALNWRRIDTDVGYYDPTRPAPELDTRVQPDVTEDEGDGSVVLPRYGLGLPAALLLIGIAVLFLRYGGGLSVSFAREAENARRGARAGGAPDTAGAMPSSLRSILSIADRRDALLRLTAAALARAIELQGLLFQKSWTGRDVLRNLPPETPLREELRALVFASERVHFGGQDVSEEEFRDHVARIRPLIEGRT